ncbi:AAA family ATPase [Neobacillus sp. NPDC093127]|uniref:AAA family ATPase n=1 Tax=Neobacillus sp. NPDC093127 TaxID=3364296 RepID=UPI00380F3ED8
MANIEAVVIKGFQSHVESTFNLCPGLNVITGPSDAGKTAIIRAVRWVSLNEPTGEAYVNQSVGEAEVRLVLDTGQIITKRRRKGKTSYLVQRDSGDDGSLFEKSEVPEEVKAVLGITKQTFGDFEAALNFAFQLDPPFLISETASAGAKVLGKLAGTEAVDMAVKAVNKDTVAFRNERSQANREVERINGDLLLYAGIDEAKEHLDLAEMVLQQIESNHNKSENLKELRQSFAVYTGQKDIFSAKLDKLAVLPEITAVLNGTEKAQRRFETLLDLLTRYNHLDSMISLLQSKMSVFSGLTVAADSVEVISDNQDKMSLLTSLYKEYKKYDELVNKNNEILLHLQDLESASSRLWQIKNHNYPFVNDLKTVNVKYEDVARRSELARNALERFIGLTEAETLLSGMTLRNERLIGLKSLSKELDDVVRRSVLAQAALERFEGLTDAEFGLSSASLKDERLTQLNTLADEYRISWLLVENTKANLNGTAVAVRTYQEDLTKAWEGAGGICPLCEQPHAGGAC